MRVLIRWLVMSLTLWMLPHLIAGVRVEGFGSALAAAAIMGVLNVLIKPLLILFTLPLTLLTLGLFIFVINAFVFQFVGVFVTGFSVESFGAAFLGALVVSLVSWIIDLNVEKREGRTVVVVSRKKRDVIDLESRK